MKCDYCGEEAITGALIRVEVGKKDKVYHAECYHKMIKAKTIKNE